MAMHWLMADLVLDQIFCFKYTRTVAADNTLRFGAARLQLQAAESLAHPVAVPRADACVVLLQRVAQHRDRRHEEHRDEREDLFDRQGGRAGQDPCLMNADDIGEPGLEFGLNSGVLVNPPPSGGEGNTSFTITLDPGLLPGPYYVTSDADGQTMSGRIDIVAPDQPVQTADDVETAAQRQYEADLAWLAGLDRVSNPPEASNPDGTKTWQAAAGVSGSNKPWLSINEFGPSQMAIIAGDTVTWTVTKAIGEPHSVTSGTPEDAGKIFDSGINLKDDGQSFQFTFDEPGEFLRLREIGRAHV